MTNEQWFKFCQSYFSYGIANADNLKTFVAHNKITADQYKQITNVDYVA